MTRENEIEQALSRTVRASLDRFQRTAEELQHAVNDLVASCSSARVANTLPPMMRAQMSAASLAASLEALSRFVTSNLQTTVAADAAPNWESVAPSSASIAEPAIARPFAQLAARPAERSVAPPLAQPLAPPAEPSIASIAHAPEPRIQHSFGPLLEPSTELAAQSHVAPEDPPVEAAVSQPPEFEVATQAAPVPQTPEFEMVAEPLQLPQPIEFEVATELREAAQVSQALPVEITAEPASPLEIAAQAAAEAVLEPLEGRPQAAPETEPELLLETVAPEPASELLLVQESALPDAEAKLTDSVQFTDCAAALAGADSLPEEVFPDSPKGFDIALLPAEVQELHRRANRVAKVSMQDIKLLRPEDVRLGQEHRDLCFRLREDLERAHKEYDRRFRCIQGHPVDYFYDWMVEILAQGDPQLLGEYPYPSAAVRR